MGKYSCFRIVVEGDNKVVTVKFVLFMLYSSDKETAFYAHDTKVSYIL